MDTREEGGEEKIGRGRRDEGRRKSDHENSNAKCRRGRLQPLFQSTYNRRNKKEPKSQRRCARMGERKRVQDAGLDPFLLRDINSGCT